MAQLQSGNIGLIQTPNDQLVTPLTSHFRLYGSQKAPLNLFSVLPEFQLDFAGREATIPVVIGTSVGIDQEGSLLLTDCNYGGKLVCRAKMISYFCQSQYRSVTT